MDRLSRSRTQVFILALACVLSARASSASDEAPTANDATAPAPEAPPSTGEEASPVAPSPPVELGPTEPPAAAAPAPSTADFPKAPADSAFPVDPAGAHRDAPGTRAEPRRQPASAQLATLSEPPPPGPRVTRASVTSLPPEPESRERDSSDGLFGPIRIGFLVGVGLPNLLNIGGTVKITRFLGGGINVGIIPTARLSYYGEATLSYQEYDIYGRIYPFGGGFFLGAGAGYEQVRGTLRGNIDLAKQMIPAGLLPPGYQLPTSVDYDARGSVRTMVLTPQLGYLHTFGSGFSIGIDIGAQIPIAPSAIKFESTASPPELAELQPFKDQQAKVRDTLKTVGQTPLPTLNFRIGWLL